MKPDNRPTADEIEEAERPRRSLWGLIPVVILIIVALIALLMLRDCAGDTSGTSGRGGFLVEPVEGMRPMEGAVAVWVASSADIDAVIESARIQVTERLDLGQGRWVLRVPPGRERQAVARLKAQPGVHDAGRVYER